ncbi:meiotic recombination protein REC114 isoform X1 [Anas acuta]|uniref:meiotic recombination protein REC114 isoform X1 n=1 Tax=Anas acuta TaxID=28680 RepID=UPI0035C8877D
MAAGGGGGSLSGSASTWPLQRYGRFLPPTDGDEEQTASSWQVFESNEESGHLILTIVVSGHFFISHGRTVLNECRMFRVQFGGDSKQQMLEHCCNCVQKLAEYVPVQVTDDQSQNLCHSLSGGSQAEDAEQVLHVVSKQEYVDAKTGKRSPISARSVNDSLFYLSTDSETKKKKSAELNSTVFFIVLYLFTSNQCFS